MSGMRQKIQYSLALERVDQGETVKRQAIGTPDRHGKGTRPGHWVRLVPVANRRVPRASRSALTSDGAARGGGACLPTGASRGGTHPLCLKRQLSLPVSMISQWWGRRSRSAVVILASPNTLGQSPKARLVVMMTEVRSSSRLIRVEEQLERFKSGPSAQRFLPPSTIIQYSTTRASRAMLRKPG